MAKSNRQLDNGIKEEYLPKFMKFVDKTLDLPVFRVGSNVFAVPVIDEEQNEKWLEVTLKVPTGSRDGESYDGEELAKEYIFNQEQKILKEKEKAEAKAKKIAADEAKRKAKAEAKAKAEKGE